MCLTAFAQYVVFGLRRRVFSENLPARQGLLRAKRRAGPATFSMVFIARRSPPQEAGMNKLELVSALKNATGISKTDAAKVVQIFFDSMTDALASGERVEIRGLCSFYVKEYKSYTGRNPKTGDPVQIQPKRLPFFKCGKELKERVDEA